MLPPLGSRTSGVDGSSEGGRIDTIQLPNILVLYGVSLLQRLRAAGFSGKVKVQPVRSDGTWCLKLVIQGEVPAGVPSRWHGHRVLVDSEPPPSKGPSV